MTYRVTELKHGVIVPDSVEDFADEESVLRNLQVSAGTEYVETVKEWLDGGAHKPLHVNESSVYSDIWEYIP